jgi:DNA-cytosine methyltransferase
MNVLSLFDGMSCGQIALDRLGVKVDTYYASEVDKYAIQIAKKNYPNTFHLGDVTKWEEWDIDYSSIDLVTGGFPCQAWSMAGKQLGDRDERGMLFWTMLDIMKTVLKANPKAYFLIENVKMKKEFEEYITHHTKEALGDVEKILINSNLVSAQSRSRYYWTNIRGIQQPEDKGIVLKDILEHGFVDRDKAHCIDANYFKGGNLKSYFEKHRRQLVFSKDGLCHVGEADLNGHDLLKRVYHAEGKAPTVNAGGGGNREPKVFIEPDQWRKLTPLECERLQTVPEGYTEGVSNTQRYKMLGNGWTVDVIAHLLHPLLAESHGQLDLFEGVA